MQRVPSNIVRECGDSLKSDKVFLKLPCGSHWKVGLTSESSTGEGKVWIAKGWPKFSRHYSIARGHSLVFAYQGNSKFHVSIFDASTTEIDYFGVNKRVKKERRDVEGLKRSKSPLKSRKRNRIGHETDDGTHIFNAQLYLIIILLIMWHFFRWDEPTGFFVNKPAFLGYFAK